MSKKLTSINNLNATNEKERKDIFLKIQTENTNLINECNSLRKEKHSLQNKIGGQLKMAKNLAREMSTVLHRSMPAPKLMNPQARESAPSQKFEMMTKKRVGGGLTTYQQYMIDRKKR